MTKDKAPRGFRSAFMRAQKMVSDSAKVQEVMDLASQKVSHQRSEMLRVAHDMQDLLRLIGSWLRGEYKGVPVKTIAFALAAVLYFLNPFDIVHDYLPIVGYIDDAAIIAFVIRAIRMDLKEYLVWEKHK